MKTILSIFLVAFLLGSTDVGAQQDIHLRGIVVEQNSLVQTGEVHNLSQVSIRSPGATPTLSDHAGRFTLAYVDQPFGNTARLRAEKEGYEVVNQKELERTTVVGRKAPVKVVMCEAGRLRENRLAYYNIAVEVVRERYARQVVALRSEGKVEQEMIATLKKEFHQDIHSKEEALALAHERYLDLREHVAELSERFATINLDDESKTYRRAFAAFREGNVEEAIGVLQAVAIKQRLAVNLQELEKEEREATELAGDLERRAEQMRQDIDQVVLKARLHQLVYEFEAAVEHFELALAYDSSNIELMWEFAGLLSDQNRFTKAKEVLIKASTRATHEETRATLLYNIGSVCINERNYKEALHYLQQALALHREIPTDTSGYLQQSEAMILTGIGNVYFEVGDYQKALAHYEEALQIYQQLAKESQYVFPKRIADTLEKLAVLYSASQNFQDAETAYQGALEQWEIMESHFPGEYEENIGIIYLNQGIHYYRAKEFVKAEESNKKALDLFRRLAAKNPEAYQPVLAHSLNSAGVLHQSRRRYGQALRCFEESLRMFESLAKKSPRTYLPEVALVLTNLGNLSNEVGTFSLTILFLERALVFQKALVVEDPDAYSPDLALILNNLGIAYEKTQRPAASVESFEAALKLYQILAKQNPAVYLRPLGNTLNSLGAHYYKQAGGTQKALEYYEQSLRCYQILADSGFGKGVPGAYRPEIAMAHFNLAMTHEDLRAYKKAEANNEEAIKMYQQLSEETGDLYHPELAEALHNQGCLFSKTGNYEGSKKKLEEALVLRKALAREHPRVFSARLAETLNKLGTVHINLDDWSGARGYLKSSYAIYDRLDPTQPNDFDLKFAENLMVVSAFDFLEGKPEQGQAKLRRAQQLIEKYPHSFEARQLREILIDLMKR